MCKCSQYEECAMRIKNAYDLYMNNKFCDDVPEKI